MSKRSAPDTSLAQLTEGLPSDVSQKANEVFARARADMETVFQEGCELETKGGLDDAAMKRIEAQLQLISGRLDGDVANSIAALKANSALRPQARWQRFMAALLLLFLIGLPLELALGEGFVFTFANAHRAALPYLFAATLPVFAIVLIRLEQEQGVLSSRFPTWPIRWLVMFPLLIAALSSALALAPLGWAAFAGWTIGSQSQPRDAKVLSIGPLRHSAGKCDQTAKLDVGRINVNICLEDRVIGPAPKAGDTLSVVGRSSPLGLYIEEIRVK